MVRWLIACLETRVTFRESHNPNDVALCFVAVCRNVSFHLSVFVSLVMQTGDSAASFTSAANALFNTRRESKSDLKPHLYGSRRSRGSKLIFATFGSGVPLRPAVISNPRNAFVHRAVRSAARIQNASIAAALRNVIYSRHSAGMQLSTATFPGWIYGVRRIAAATAANVPDCGKVSAEGSGPGTHRLAGNVALRFSGRRRLAQSEPHCVSRDEHVRAAQRIRASFA